MIRLKNYDKCYLFKDNSITKSGATKIHGQSINGIIKHQISFVWNQSYFKKLKSVVALKIGFLSITCFIFYFNFLIIFNFDLY